MDSIQEPNKSFLFSNLILTPPVNSSGGNHFMKFKMSPAELGASDSSDIYKSLKQDLSLDAGDSSGVKLVKHETPLYIQTPKCKTKPVIIKQNSKRAFLDLIFTNENEEFIQWIENLETHCQKFIYSKKESWFDSTLEESDIENLFTSILKSMKMGKFYLLRANIPIVTSTMKIYDENENLLSFDDLKEDTNIICILEFQGIKCSARGFQVEIEVKQILVLKPINIFDRCILSKRDSEKQSLDKIDLLLNKKENGEHPSSLPYCVGDPMHRISEPDLATTPISVITREKILPEDPLEDTEDPEDPEDPLEDTEDPLEDPTLKNLSIKDETATETSFAKISLPSSSYDEATDIDVNDIDVVSPTENSSELLEINLNLEEIPKEESVIIKKRNDIYYEMYKEAIKKAKMSKDLALSSYLEAKRIKNLYIMDDVPDDISDDSELEDFIESVTSKNTQNNI